MRRTPKGRSGISVRTPQSSDGEIVSREGSFEAGVMAHSPDVVPADPQPGMGYRQEYYAGGAEDNGDVLSTEAMADAPVGHFTDVLLTWDTITIEPDVAELKFCRTGRRPRARARRRRRALLREELIAMDTVPDGTGMGPSAPPTKRHSNRVEGTPRRIRFQRSSENADPAAASRDGLGEN